MNRQSAVFFILLPILYLSPSLKHTDYEESQRVDSDLLSARIELGRDLFYDPLLSGANDISCASCHRPEYYFADTAQFSIGNGGLKTFRNSMPLFNLRSASGLVWDGRVKELNEFAMHPITSEREMNQNPDTLVSELTAIDSYVQSFSFCYPDEGVSVVTISKAIGSFLSSISSESSPLDERIDSLKGTKYSQDLNNPTAYKRALFPSYSERTISALNLCEKCHNGQNYGGNQYRNNGLQISMIDSGRYNATGDTNDIGKFKVVSLRNIARTAPYMHDGRFKTLQQVLDHYNSGIQNSATLDSILIDSSGNPIRLNLGTREIAEIVDFLNLLTDSTFPGKYADREY